MDHQMVELDFWPRNYYFVVIKSFDTYHNDVTTKRLMFLVPYQVGGRLAAWWVLGKMSHELTCHILNKLSKLLRCYSFTPETITYSLDRLPHGYPFGDPGPPFFPGPHSLYRLRDSVKVQCSHYLMSTICVDHLITCDNTNTVQKVMTHFFSSNKLLYFNELAHFGQFVKYTIYFGSPFLLPRVPICSGCIKVLN